MRAGSEHETSTRAPGQPRGSHGTYICVSALKAAVLVHCVVFLKNDNQDT